MEEDAEGMDRLDMDGDYVGGRFDRDGEFYYQSRRERAPQTRDDALYGVFAEGDSDYDSEEDEASRHRRHRKRRRDESEPDFTRPVQFVSKGISGPERPEEEETEQRPGLGQAASNSRTAVAISEDDADEDQEEYDLPTGFGQRIAEGARARRKEKERQQEPAKRHHTAPSAGFEHGKPALAPGSLESNTTVAKIMAMMGFKRGQGLGKNAQGITAPVETTLRPKNAGLGSVEGFKEPKAFTPKENLPPPPPPPPAKKEKQRWSKKASLNKDQVLTKNELLARRAEKEHDEQPTFVQKVIDMRGPQARVLTDLKGLSNEHEMEANDVPTPELQYNVRLLVDETEADIVRLDGQLRREKEKVAKQEALQKHQLQVMETIAGVLEQVRVDDTAGLLTLGGLLKTFQELKVRYEQEFKMCSVAWVDQFNWVMIWASAVPVHHMVHMLEVDFFSKWQQVLYHWLCSPNPDFNEIMNWYKGWRGLFPPELLANERIRMLLTAGLEMINQVADGHELAQPGTRENVGFLRATEKRQFDAAQQASQYPSYRAVPGAATSDMSFKDSIQEYAVDQGLLFMPRVGKFHKGMQVYEFGTVNICIDSVKRLLYAQLQEGAERWSSVSLTQLLEMNRMAMPR